MNRLLLWLLFFGRPHHRRTGRHLAVDADLLVRRPTLDLPDDFTLVPAAAPARPGKRADAARLRLVS